MDFFKVKEIELIAEWLSRELENTPQIEALKSGYSPMHSFENQTPLYDYELIEKYPA